MSPQIERVGFFLASLALTSVGTFIATASRLEWSKGATVQSGTELQRPDFVEAEIKIRCDGGDGLGEITDVLALLSAEQTTYITQVKPQFQRKQKNS